MKKALTLILYLFIGIATMQAQKDVTTFLGIPVDGTKATMRQKLIAKGFKAVPGAEALKGEFNGEDVYIYIQTVNNKVWRLNIWNKNSMTKRLTIQKFNNLMQQFENNPRYYSYIDNQMISEDEDITYQISIKEEQYQATFYQKAKNKDEADLNKTVWFKISEASGEYKKYVISMHYENGYNEANGQDL